MPAAANMVRDLSSPRSETAFRAYYMVRDLPNTQSDRFTAHCSQLVRDLSSTPPETAFSAYCSHHGLRPPKHPVRDGLWCLLQPTWSETFQAPGPRPLLVPTAANMVRDLSSTRSDTGFTAHCSQHGPRPLKYPVRDRF